MRFLSLHWLSGHETSAIVPCSRNSAIKSFSDLTKGNHQDVAIFVVVRKNMKIQINYFTRACWIWNNRSNRDTPSLKH